jgi:hypothetical protein
MNIFRVSFYLSFLSALSLSPFLFGQERDISTIRGKLVTEELNPASEIQVTIPSLKLLTTTDDEGRFGFSPVPYGTYKLFIISGSRKTDSIKIIAGKDLVDLGTITVGIADKVESEFRLPQIEIDDAMMSQEDDPGSSQDISGLLNASRDPFLNASGFIFSAYNFNKRGYDRSQEELQINGITLNDIGTGNLFFGQVSGLNDVLKGKTFSYGLAASDYGFGSINGLTYIDATAAAQRRQTKIGYALSNRTYRNRIMLTHSSGLSKTRWSYALSYSKRWAREGYIPGTFYDGHSFYAAISKQVNSRHSIHFTTLGSMSNNGTSSPGYKEAYDLAGSNYYNPNWGYQDGKKRNARVHKAFQPIAILNYRFSPNDNLEWNVSLANQTGRNSRSGLDWYNAADPRPDYYRYLPSYYLNSDPSDLIAADSVRAGFISDHQVKWDELYQANQLNMQAIPNPDGSAGPDSGLRSLYVLGSDVEESKKWMFNTNIRKTMNDHITLYTGFSFIRQQSEYYKEMEDLLGGNYFVNVNSFTEMNFNGVSTLSDYDINHPNALIRVGDKYAYDYLVRFQKIQFWGQANFTFKKADLFIAANYGSVSFQREGLFRNGLFALGNDSYGKSEVQKFATYGLKGGVTYKINGRNYLFANGLHSAESPDLNNVYFSARIRNAVAENSVTQKLYSVEGGYLHRSPLLNARAVGYATDIGDAVETQRFFYNGTGSSNSNVAYVLQGVNMRFTGMEVAADYKINSSFSVSVIAALGQAFYTSNPKATINNENFVDSVVQTEKIYIRNYYLGVGPQTATTFGVSYKGKDYWWANLNLNYFDRNYIRLAATRHTEQVMDLVEPGSDKWHELMDQEKLPSAYTVDISLSKSLLLSKMNSRIRKNTFLFLNLGISNLLDNLSVINYGMENARFDYTNAVVNKFPPKYSYGRGRNFYAAVSLRF